jgi:chromosome segregation ATPase
VREPSLEVPDGSLAALTAEVRQLRAAVEKLARSQTETQALAAYLSAQQSRMAQTAQQLDAARKELDSANARSRDVEARLGDISAALAGTADRDERARLDDGMRGFKAEQSRVALELEQARTRESDLSGQLQAEERRWNELISRIEQLSQ